MKYFIIGFVFLFSSVWAQQEVKVIKNPEPNMVEQDYVRLIKHRELKETGDSTEFLAHIESLAVDNEANVYVYDPIQAKIFKYDSELRFIKTFARKGQGPGEITPGGRFTNAGLQVKNGIVYLADQRGKKIICFSVEGEYIREIAFRDRQSMEMYPAVDQAGNIYLHADFGEQNEHVVNCYDEIGQYKKGFLAKSNLFNALFAEYEQKRNMEITAKLPKDFWLPNLYNSSKQTNVLFALNQKGQLVVFSTISGTLWVFSGDELQTTARLWPKNVLQEYKLVFEDSLKRGGFSIYFHELIIDQDEDQSFFLDFGYFKSGDKSHLYKFNIKGALQKVLYVVNPNRRIIHFKAKKNGCYYAITRNDDHNLTISVFKEVEHE